MRQHIPRLAAQGIEIREFSAWLGSYPPAQRLARPCWAAATLAQRIPHVFSSRRSEVTLLQREILSTTCTLEPFTGRPRILDVDDAIWLHPRGDFARRLAACCDLVICGNAFLAARFSGWNPNVVIIPTAVDTSRYRPGSPAPGGEVIGWCGTSSGLRFLREIEPALAETLRRRPNATLRIVCDARPGLPSIPAERLAYVRWSQEGEVAALQGMSVGLMPLEDTPWCQGKCSFKMLLYMACGVPVVCSPVGMNRDVLGAGACGFPAASQADWVEAVCTLLGDPAQASAMGAQGREIVERQYSLDVVTPQLAAAIRSVAA